MNPKDMRRREQKGSRKRNWKKQNWTWIEKLKRFEKMKYRNANRVRTVTLKRTNNKRAWDNEIRK